MASDPETDDLPVSNSSKGYATSGKIMLSAIVTLFAVIIFMLCLHLYARCFIYRRRRRRRLLRQTHLVFYMEPANSADASRGLDAAVLESLPVFVYDSKTHPEIPECAVCLSEFDANEKGRVLPKCNHSFHIECIDMWLCSHSTCPLCRSPIEPEPPLEIVVEPEPSRTVPTGEEGALPENSSSFRTTSSWERRKPLSLSLETEPGSTESPVSQAFKSPSVRGLSLMRIMNRRGLSFSGPVCGGGSVSGSELGVEEGSERTRTLTPR